MLVTCVAFSLPGLGADRRSEKPALRASAGERGELITYVEAIAQIRERALFVGDEGGGRVIADTLKAYLLLKDPFSDFLTRDEYARFKGSGQGQQAGIGMEIEKRRNGDVLCFPYPNGPAARVGIEPGDRLIAIEGISARNNALPTLAAAARGTVSTPVSVEVVGKDQRRRQLRIVREPVAERKTALHAYGTVQVIEIPSFTSLTESDVAYLLSTWKSDVPVIIDLRGNFGGDFYAAVDLAMLFLPQGETVVSLRTKSGSRAYVSTLAGPRPPRRVILWQDEATASAAEVFIAALTENGRAVSIGRTTFGKGTRQDIIELSDGAALILTTGYLRTPKGTEFDGVGLPPNEDLGPGAGTAAYLARSSKLSSRRRMSPANSGAEPRRPPARPGADPESLAVTREPR